MTLFVALLLVGCKTTKQTVQVQQDVKTIENRDVVEKQDGTIVVAVAEVVETENETTTQTESSEALAIVETTTVLSKPDSTGKQNPTSITVKETKRVSNDKQFVQDKQVTNHARDSTAAEALEIERTDKTDLKSDSSIELDTTTKTKVSTPRPFVWLSIILGVGALVFVYFILRRYNIL